MRWLAELGAERLDWFPVEADSMMGFTGKQLLDPADPDGPSWVGFALVRPGGRLQALGLVGYGVEPDTSDPVFMDFYDRLCRRLDWMVGGQPAQGTLRLEEVYSGTSWLNYNGDFVGVHGTEDMQGELIGTAFVISRDQWTVDMFVF